MNSILAAANPKNHRLRMSGRVDHQQILVVKSNCSGVEGIHDPIGELVRPHHRIGGIFQQDAARVVLRRSQGTAILKMRLGSGERLIREHCSYMKLFRNIAI